jgi:salicylate hydroxylase
MKIAIVGAGIGGLAAALFLRRDGHQVTIYEQASSIEQTGAGIVVPPNLVRPLQRLGLLKRLQAVSTRLEAAWEFRRWQSGAVLSSQPMGDECEALYGAACYTAHRADLIDCLAEQIPASEIRLGCRCIQLDQDDSGVVLQIETAGSNTLETVDLAIGADGIHSRVRTSVSQPVEPRFSGLCAWRCLVPADTAPDFARRPVQTIWLGPQRHFVHYPVRAGQLVNIVAIAPAGDWRDESWVAQGKVADLAQEFSGWDRRVTDLIDAAEQTSRWALYDRDPLQSWCAGRIGLIGDAAHAMLPFFAQGAAQAVEDAETLASCLRSTPQSETPAALKQYEHIRRQRADRVMLMSRGRERQNHLPDGEQQRQRDAQLRVGEPLRQSAWLYGSAHESEQI